MPFLVFLFVGFVIYIVEPTVFSLSVIIIVASILILLISTYRKKSYLTKEPSKRVIQNKGSSPHQLSQTPTQKNTSWQESKETKRRKANQKKGEDGEKAFQVFLEKIKIPFIFADQEPNTKYSGFKRPDFILGYEYNSNKFPIAFEVKNHQTSTDEYGNKCHKLEIDELNGLKNFSRKMFMPVYFAFKDGYDWLFISLKQFDADDFSFKYQSKFDTHPYRYIRLYRFEKGIKNRDDFDNFINKHKAS